jgi:hypothetical protein
MMQTHSSGTHHQEDADGFEDEEGVAVHMKPSLLFMPT